MAKRVKVIKRPFPYELRDELGELARFLAPDGVFKPGLPVPGDSPLWDMVYAQLLASLRLLEVAKLVEKMDSVEREAVKNFAHTLKMEGDTIAKSLLEIFHSVEPVSLTVTKTRNGYFFADQVTGTRSESLAKTLEAAAKARKKGRKTS